MLLAQGAEAQLEQITWHGRPAVVKQRETKRYRHPELEARLAPARLRDEAHLLVAARKAGVPVPTLYDLDVAKGLIVMQFIPGVTLKQALTQDGQSGQIERMAARLRHVGTLVAKLHAAGITHGDLTTSNILVTDMANPTSLTIIDFGLGRLIEEDEPRGVDLHLLEEALEATEADAAALFAAVLDGYQWSGRDAALVRLEGIRSRGRYK